MSKQVVRVGIVGCGGIAEVHRRAIEQIPDVRIVAVYDIRRTAAEALAARASATVAPSLDAMVSRDVVDAVVICTPPVGREALCLPFIEAGVAVLCEKPLEADAEAASRLAEAVQRSGSPFMLGFCHRFHGPILELRRLIDSGQLGRPLLLRNMFSGYLQLKGNHRADPRVAGGGCLIDNGTHAVDLFRHLVGEPSQVQAVGGAAVQDTAVEDFALLTLTTDSNAFGEIINSFSFKVGSNVVEWYGTEGAAVVNYGKPDQPDLSYRRAGDEQWTEVDCSAHPPRFVGQWQRFIAAVRGEAEAWPSLHDGLRACQIIEAAYAAMRTGQRQPAAPISQPAVMEQTFTG